MKISFIGGGNMGEAILAALLKKRMSTPENILVSDVSETRRQYLAQQYGISATGDNLLTVKDRDVLVLAVKPQNLPEATAGIRGMLPPPQLVLSIVAGASLKTLSHDLQHPRVVRAMPNTPARISEGITVWTASPGVTETQKKRAADILGVMGTAIYVDDEKYIDMATAISGSGPAYFFYFVEALTAAARGIGLPQDVAEKLVRQTVLGSNHLLQKSAEPPAKLRRMVTSPGGTTAAALRVLEEGQFAALLQKAITAAYHRARELGS